MNHDIETDAELDFADGYNSPSKYDQEEEYDHEDYVYNSSDAYMYPEKGLDYDARHRSAYTSWQ